MSEKIQRLCTFNGLRPEEFSGRITRYTGISRYSPALSSTRHKPDFDTLVRLLDDPSGAVHEALVGAFREQGEPAVLRLRKIADNPGDPLAAHAAGMLRSLGDSDHAGAFLRHIRSGATDLEEGCLLFERVLNPAVTAKDFTDPLDAMAARARALLEPGMPVRDACKILNRVIFHEWGYRGDQGIFLHPDGSLVSRVLQTRRGIPISLCIIYLLVARRCSVAIAPIGLPGRFMLGHGTEGPEGWFLDCYDGGVFRTRTEVKLILLQNGLPATDDFLLPVDAAETLCRCCRNLCSQLEAVGDSANAAIFLGFVRELEKSGSNDDDSR